MSHVNATPALAFNNMNTWSTLIITHSGDENK